MTVKELYEEAVKEGKEDYEMVYIRDCWSRDVISCAEFIETYDGEKQVELS